jgi:peptidyl-prolyl cis-trans isomerase A (cyclophilin A)
MIQGGCPIGQGTGGPGYNFEDELSKDLRFDRTGRLAMANAGPNTNGSQFFITVAPTDWLNDRHTIFGQVVKGQDVVEKIANLPRGRNDKPQTPVVIDTVKIVEIK